jgi:hypothetical protein
MAALQALPRRASSPRPSPAKLSCPTADGRLGLQRVGFAGCRRSRVRRAEWPVPGRESVADRPEPVDRRPKVLGGKPPFAAQWYSFIINVLVAIAIVRKSLVADRLLSELQER